jgi:putative proteasome-type protease
MLDAGMVFASDSRTNAGVDQIATFRKMHVIATGGDRLIVVLSSGNLSISQSSINLLEHQSRSGDSNDHIQCVVDVRNRRSSRQRCAKCGGVMARI